MLDADSQIGQETATAATESMDGYSREWRISVDVRTEQLKRSIEPSHPKMAPNRPRKIFLDANVVIRAGKPPGGPLIPRVADLVAAGYVTVVTTDLTKVEIVNRRPTLTPPRLGSKWLYQQRNCIFLDDLIGVQS
jgi:hypothetical protein